MSGINDIRQRHFAGCIFIVVQVRFELTLERVWAVCLCQLGYRTIYLKIVARDGTAPPPDDSESSILLLYERAMKTRYWRHFSGRYCFALSFQASISFPQVQTVSAANIMSLIHAGRGRRLEELPQCNYPTLLHISCDIRMLRRCCEYLLK